MSGLPDNILNLINVAILMAQELQEFVGDAVEASGQENALEATQALLKDWEDAYASSGLSWQDQFALERKAADEEFIKI